jgi:hypothetical protein
MSAGSLLEPRCNLRSFWCDTARSHPPDDHSRRASEQDRERRPVCPGGRSCADGVRTLPSARRNQLAVVRHRSSPSREAHSGSADRDRRLLLQSRLRRLGCHGSVPAGARLFERPTLHRRQERMARRRIAARARRKAIRTGAAEQDKQLASGCDVLALPAHAWPVRARLQRRARSGAVEVERAGCPGFPSGCASPLAARAAA